MHSEHISNNKLKIKYLKSQVEKLGNLQQHDNKIKWDLVKAVSLYHAFIHMFWKFIIKLLHVCQIFLLFDLVRSFHKYIFTLEKSEV